MIFDLNQERFRGLKKYLPVIAIALSVLLFGAVFFGNHFLGFVWIVNGIILSLLLGALAIMAGFAVLKSLFLLAGELSLLIFLAQSYCDVPKRLALNDSALKSLMVLGLLYIAFSFLQSLREALKENYKIVENKRWSQEKFTAIALYLMFVGLFIWEIFLVINPIVLNLCVFNK